MGYEQKACIFRSCWEVVYRDSAIQPDATVSRMWCFVRQCCCLLAFFLLFFRESDDDEESLPRGRGRQRKEDIFHFSSVSVMLVLPSLPI